MLDHESLVIEHFNKLKEHGIGISIDDFGTGYSSFAYLRDYPLSTVKIDKSFIDHISTNKKDLAIVKAILALSEQMNMDVIVEGVETLELVSTLKAINCKYLQGYYYSRPLPPDEYLNLMLNNQSEFKQVQMS